MAAPAITFAADSTSASGRTIEALSPPISAWLAIPRAVAAAATPRPTAVEPVNDTTSASSTTACPAAPGPVTTLKTPSGRCWLRISWSRSAQAIASDAGLSTTALPYASAGAAFHNGIANGKFQGVISPATPRGRRRLNSSVRGSEGGAAGEGAPSGATPGCARGGREGPGGPRSPPAP